MNRTSIKTGDDVLLFPEDVDGVVADAFHAKVDAVRRTSASVSDLTGVAGGVVEVSRDLATSRRPGR